MAETGVAIAAARVDAVARLQALIDDTYEARGPGPFPFAQLALEGRLETALSQRPAVEVEDDYVSLLSEMRERDRLAGRALAGPHLSNLLVFHGPREAPAESCSSGEQKALLLGLVLAKARLVRALSGVSPLVLLDEVAAHLDAARREALFGEILDLGAQAWMTGTDRSVFAPLAGHAQLVAVRQGCVSVP
jgi:DNA replication and repair protein RecF